MFQDTTLSYNIQASWIEWPETMLSSAVSHWQSLTFAPPFQEGIAWLTEGVQNLSCNLYSGNWKVGGVKHSKLNKYAGLIPVP